MKPAFVFGIDGLPFTLAKRLIGQGIMPNLGALANQGTLAQMHTTVPDFSCVAWTSFATGVNPGKHGIYGFMDFDETNGQQILPDATHCKASPLWHLVGNEGGRSIILNLPNTYPAMPLRGKMVSGFIAPEFDASCYPPTFAQTLKTLGYKMHLDGRVGLGSPEHVRDCVMPVFEARKTAIRHIIKNEYWDLAVCVITETDRLQHYFLHALEQESHPQHQWARNFYIELDRFIGEVVELLADKVDLYMISDHGFNVVKKEYELEPFLADLGLAPKVNHTCWSESESAKQTKVFCLDPGRFYINRVNSRFEYGCVKPNEEAEILDRITQALLALEDSETGEKVVSSAGHRI